MHCSICGSFGTNCSTCPDNPNNHGRYNFKKHREAIGLYTKVQTKVQTSLPTKLPNNVPTKHNDDDSYITNMLNKHCVCDICDEISINSLKTCGIHGLQYCSKHTYCVICNKKLIENISMSKFCSELFELSIADMMLKKLTLY